MSGNIIYRVDRSDIIVSVNRAWDDFALANCSPDMLSSNVVGRRIWDFISGDSLIYVYGQIFASARSGRTLDFDFRCDSPGERRLLNISFSMEPDGFLRISTSPLHVETRVEQWVLDRPGVENSALVVACSWCNRIRTSPETWEEIETAVGELELFRSSSVPQLSHGLCRSCYTTTMSKVLVG